MKVVATQVFYVILKYTQAEWNILSDNCKTGNVVRERVLVGKEPTQK